VNKTIKKIELNPNIDLRLISIQLECLICTIGYFTQQAVIYCRLVVQYLRGIFWLCVLHVVFRYYCRKWGYFRF